MKYYAFLIDEKLIGVGQARMMNEGIQNIEITKEFFDEYREDKDKYVYSNGKFVLNPEFEKKRQAQVLAQAKQERDEAVASIVVEVDGMKFDGDEVSQGRMARSAVAMNDDETITWVLNDNSIAQVTKEQLLKALRLSGEEQTRLWTMPYEVKTNE